jgi:hypothetical protein
MDDTDMDMDRIAGAVDGNGDEVPQDHPIENPGGNDDERADPIDEPHPDEPGAPDPDEEDPSAPDAD